MIQAECELLQKMDEAWRYGNIHLMPSLHQRHIASHGNSPSDVLCVARSHYLMGEYGRCIEKLDSCSIASSSPSAKVLMSKSFYSLGLSRKSFELAHLVTKDDSSTEIERAEAYEIMAYGYDELGHIDEAMSMATKCFKMNSIIGYRCLWRLGYLDKTKILPILTDYIDENDSVYNLLVSLSSSTFYNNPLLTIGYIQELQRLGVLDNILSVYFYFYKYYYELDIVLAEEILRYLKRTFSNSYHPYAIRSAFITSHNIHVPQEKIHELVEELEEGLRSDLFVENFNMYYFLIQMLYILNNREHLYKCIDYINRILDMSIKKKYVFYETAEIGHILLIGVRVSRKVRSITHILKYSYNYLRWLKKVGSNEEIGKRCGFY